MSDANGSDRTRRGPPRPDREGPGDGAPPAAGGAATDWLFALQRFGVRPGLERVHELLDALGRPQDGFDAVLVAGTNGKGAVTGALAAMLDASGRPSGRFTSPHLVRPGERIVVAGRELAGDAFERLAARVRPRAEAVGATFFEVVTAMACLAFAEAGVRTAVFEAGMGGRHDATNALDPVASILTNVALDHTEVLGASVEAIARDKSGILRTGRPAWTAAEGAALQAIREEAASIRAPLRRLVPVPDDVAPAPLSDASDAAYAVASRGWDGIVVEVRRLPRPGRAAGPGPALGGASGSGASAADGRALRLESPMPGRHQGANLALAALTARELGVADDAIRDAVRGFAWPGRLERVDPAAAGFDDVRMLLDGAHNPAAAAVLAAALADLDVRPHLVFGASREKDATGILATLAPAVASVRLTRARTSPRAALPAGLEDVARSVGAPVAAAYERPTEAVLAAAAEATRDGSAVLVAGSLYLVGEIRPWLLGEPVPRHERWQ